LSFGGFPKDASITDGTLCERTPGGPRTTLCDGANGELAMSFCIACDEMPYAMCVSETPMDLTQLARNDGSRALTVRFVFESDTVAKTRVNLYYAVTFDEDGEGEGEAVEVRRYYPLLEVGDAPGTYLRTFLLQHTCHAKNEDAGVDCGGVSALCSGCRNGDTCGAPTGDDCEALAATSARLQVAADWSACEGEFRGTVRIEELWYGPLACDRI
jgi:hypothetical protein